MMTALATSRFLELAQGFAHNLQTALGIGTAMPWLAAGFVAMSAVLLAWVPRQRRRVGTALLLFIGAAGALVIAAALLTDGFPADGSAYRWTRFVGQLLLGAAIINVAAVVLFDVLLSAVRLRPPAIVSDILIAITYIVVFVALLSGAGVNLTGIVATSAVFTAVIAFSLQDTLGNIMGGMAVQLDRSIGVGDWIRVGDVEGRVVQIRWRHTAIETRNWDTVLIPNSGIVKSQVTVLGRREGQPTQRRQAVLFHVDYRHSPTRVIDAVEAALRAEAAAGALPDAAREPAPQCVMTEYRDSYATYAVRYWLTNLASNDGADSMVRAVIYGALRRANIPPSMPAQQVFFTEQDAARRDRKAEEALADRAAAIAAVDLFAPLTDDERHQLAGRIKTAPFVRGETITRQGTRGDWLYLLVTGRAEVKVATDNGGGRDSRHVADLRPGDFFGEMGLMTGGERTATVVATTDSTCYRIDKADLEPILATRPEIAEDVAQILARRRTELDAVREDLNEDAKRRRMSEAQGDLLQRIRRFFTLGE